MRYSIIHTSSRPHQWRQIYDAWLAAADDPGTVEYVLVVDKRWGFTSLPELRPQDKAIWATGRKCYVDGVNLGAAASTGEVLIVNADDQWPCERWDYHLDNRYGEMVVHDPKTEDFLIWPATGTTDEFTRGICVMPIMSRARYERLGYVFYPCYESMYADNDLHDHAQQDGCIIKAEHLLFPHRHPLMGCADMDEQYQAQNRPEAYSLGREVWAARRANGFKDLGPGWKPSQFRREFGAPNHPSLAMIPPTTKPRLAVLLPGETFSYEWVQHWTILFNELQNHFAVTPIFGFSTNVYVTRENLLNTALAHDPDFLLWIDDDNLVTPKNVLQLIQDINEVPEADAATGWCWSATVDGVMVSCGHLNENGTVRRLPYQEMMDGADLGWVDWTGFPCIFMKRSMINKAGPLPFAPIFVPDHPMGFTGEDISFCRHAAERGGARIVLDRRVEVKHIKPGALALSTTVRNPRVLATAGTHSSTHSKQPSPLSRQMATAVK